MSRIVILGAGVSGHTAAQHLRRSLGSEHEVVVVSPNSNWNWIPSNIWVGVSKMAKSDVTFPLAPIYRRAGITFHQARAVALHPEGTPDGGGPAVDIVSTATATSGAEQRLTYDYLVNATGPKLRFEATPGLGPSGHSLSVCTADHATATAKALERVIEELALGRPQTLVIGMGHGACTCEGAAFEYVFNVDHVLRERGVRDLATVVYLTNEHELGDFGVGGMEFRGGLTSEHWMASLFAERGIQVILRAHVTEVREHEVAYDTIDGFERGPALRLRHAAAAVRRRGAAGGRSGGCRHHRHHVRPRAGSSGSMPTTRPVRTSSGLPPTGREPTSRRCFGERVRPSASPSLLRTRSLAPIRRPPMLPSHRRRLARACRRVSRARRLPETIVKRIRSGDPSAPAETASMADMGAACIASIGAGMRSGAAAPRSRCHRSSPTGSATPETGRDLDATFGEVGLAGHWMKRLLHTVFIYKAKARPGWWLIPE